MLGLQLCDSFHGPAKFDAQNFELLICAKMSRAGGLFQFKRSTGSLLGFKHSAHSFDRMRVNLYAVYITRGAGLLQGAEEFA
jgi:hypothetical protein